MGNTSSVLSQNIQRSNAETYFLREAEGRKVRLINQEIDYVDSIVDLGCCNGLYGEVLKSKTKKLIGVDMNQDFVNYCKASGHYDAVIKSEVPPFDFKDKEISVFFASEVIEHVPTLNPMMEEIERITADKIILTMPNPAYPHFYDDPTHVLKYTIKSLKKDLNKSKDFEYKVFGMGFEHAPIGGLLKRLTQILFKPFPSLSPTIGVIGVPRKKA